MKIKNRILFKSIAIIMFVLVYAFSAYGGADPPTSGVLPFYGPTDAANKDFIDWEGYLVVTFELVDPASLSSQMVEGLPDAGPDYIVKPRFYLTLKRQSKGNEIVKVFSGEGIYESQTTGFAYNHIWLKEGTGNGTIGMMWDRFLNDKVYARCTDLAAGIDCSADTCGGFLDGSDPQTLSNVPTFPGPRLDPYTDTILPTGEPLYAASNVIIQTICDLE